MKKVVEHLQCRICGRRGQFTRHEAPFSGRFREICSNGEGFTHGVLRNGHHILINIEQDEVEKPELILQ